MTPRSKYLGLIVTCLFGAWILIGTAFGQVSTTGSFDEPVFDEEDGLRGADPFVIIDIWFARCGSGSVVSCPYSFETCYKVCVEIENQSVWPHYLDEIYMSYYPTSGAGHTTWEDVLFGSYDNQVFCIENTIPMSDQCSGRVGSVCLSDEGDISFECETTGACYPPTGSSCDDLEWCTISDQCRNYICDGTPRSCSGGDQCNEAVCDEV